MKLTEISYKVGTLEFNIEENNNDSYSVMVIDKDGSKLLSYRTDETMTDDIIEGLKYLKNYNFIQEDKEDKNE